MLVQAKKCSDVVIRRVGGLEVPRFGRSAIKPVIRRVGGLEVIITLSFLVLVVIRRVGGLEEGIHSIKALSSGYPPCRRLRRQ